MNKNNIIEYINWLYPDHTDISFCENFTGDIIWTQGDDKVIRYNYTINNNIMRLSDDGRVFKSHFDAWKRDKQIDKIWQN
jgi:hypothetical protein